MHSGYDILLYRLLCIAVFNECISLPYDLYFIKLPNTREVDVMSRLNSAFLTVCDLLRSRLSIGKCNDFGFMASRAVVTLCGLADD